MKRRLWALVLAMLTLTACAEIKSNLERADSWVKSSLERADSWVKAHTKAESQTASPTASSTASSAGPSAANKNSNRILAKPPRRKPDQGRRSLAKPMRKPAPKTAVPKAAVASTLSLDPKLLLGLDFNTTKAILGNPEVEYEEPPAKVWTYRGGTCSFSVYFFPNLKDSVMRVLNYEVTGNDQATNSKESDSKSSAESAQDGAKKLARRCFAELLIGHAAPDEG